MWLNTWTYLVSFGSIEMGSWYPLIITVQPFILHTSDITTWQLIVKTNWVISRHYKQFHLISIYGGPC